MASMKRTRTARSIPATIALFSMAALFVAPMLWMTSTAFKTNAAAMRLPPEWWPRNPTLDNFARVLKDLRFLRFYRNSLIVAGGTTVSGIGLAVLAGYSFSRYKFRGSGLLQMLVLSTQMFPAMVLLLALYAMYLKAGLINSYAALVLACTTNALPLCVWMLRGYYDTVPRSLEEAAYIDGAGRLQTLFRVVLPLVQPGIAAVAIYNFMVSWDDFLWGLTLVNKMEMRTLAPGIALAYMGEFSYDWANVMTASVAASLPMLLAFIFLQRYMIAGMTAGAVKG